MPKPPSLSPEKFEAIAAAIAGSESGKQFLAEFARRNRQHQNAALAGAFDQLEDAVARNVFGAGPAPGGAIAKPAAALAARTSSVASEAAVPARIDHAIGELDGIVETTTSLTAALLTAAKRARAFAEEPRPLADIRAEFGLLAADIEAYALQAQVGSRTREICEILLELKSHFEQSLTTNTPVGAGASPGWIEREQRTFIHTVFSPTKVVTSSSTVAANDSKPQQIFPALRMLSEDERTALFT